MLQSSSSPSSLERLFRPKAVAVVGVSKEPTKLGSRVFANLLASGFPGQVYPIGRNLDAIGGWRAYGSVCDVPERVDAAFFALPAAATLAALEEAGEAGLRFAIIGSSGFGESGDDTVRHRLLDIVARTGMQIVGPNCNGIFNAALPLSLGFNRAHGERWPAGSVSVLSHSGALFHPLMRLLTQNESGLACFVSAGNEDNLGVLDYAEFLIEDAQTRVLALLIDALHDGERFVRLVARADELGKSIVVLKLGKSDLGAGAAVAHSSRMTGQADAYTALFRALGVAEVTTIEALMAAAAVLDRFGRRSGDLAVLTTSGAGGALIADVGTGHGLRFAELEPPTLDVLEQERLFSRIGNPTDLGIFRDERRWPMIAETIASDAQVGAVLAYFHSFGGGAARNLTQSLAAARTASGKPLLALCPGGLDPDEAELYRAGDMMILHDTESGLQAVAALLQHRGEAAAMLATGEEVPSDRLDQAGPMSEADSLALLGRYGVPVVPLRRCATAAEAVAAARQIGWPVAVKAMVEGEAHKTERGFVRLNLGDEAAVEEAVAGFGDVPAVIVQPMIRGELEVIAGISRAPGVGLMLMVGLGGIHAEAMRAAILWPIGLSREGAAARLDDSALGRLLQSPRWRWPAAREALLDALMALRAFALAMGDSVEAVDINPLVLGGHGVVAVDALVIGRDRDLVS